MKLKSYTPQTVPHQARTGTTQVRISRKNGLFQFTKQASLEIDFSHCKSIKFHQDEENPMDWFFELLENDFGFPLKPKGDTGTFAAQSVTMADKLLQSLNLPENSYKFQISKTPIQYSFPDVEGVSLLYPIITKSAKI